MGTPEPTTITEAEFSERADYRPPHSGSDLTDEQAVENGAAWLDHIKPGWESLINTDELYMFDSKKCIAGQALRDEAKAAGKTTGYDWVFETQGIPFTAAHGFVTHREVWIDLIEARRAAA